MNQTPYLLRAAEIEASTQSISHPWNPDSEIRGTMLARTLGLTRTGVSLARIRSGKESFVYHSHRYEEEWIYILSGKGVAEIDGNEYEVGAGDFMAFPTPSVAHHLRNPFAEDLVYLMGGESRPFEIADFPRMRKRMIRDGTDVQIYDVADAKPFGPLND
jgi:uncharacterized cupin superfamily protein